MENNMDCIMNIVGWMMIYLLGLFCFGVTAAILLVLRHAIKEIK